MRADVVFDPNELERLKRAVAKRKSQICERIAGLAERNANQYAGDKTPGTNYEASVEELGSGGRLQVTLEVNPDNDHADMIFRMAVGGRKAYTIQARLKGALAWDPGDGYEPNARSGKHVRWVPRDVYAREGRSASQVFIPAKGPTVDPDFVRAALRNAVSRVRNDYR